MPYVLTYQGTVGAVNVGQQTIPLGAYLKDADVDAHDGRGVADWSTFPWQAKTFESLEDAAAFWNQQSTKRPLREDGHPNKPLTAFSVEIRQL